eukprot:5438730-Amphidinium_carterae.1
MAEDLSSKVTAAAAALQRHSEEMGKRTQALMNAAKTRPSHPYQSSSGGQGVSKRKQKAQDWFLKMKARKGSADGGIRPPNNSDAFADDGEDLQLVPHGMGAVRGATPEEQVQQVLEFAHPLLGYHSSLRADIREAVAFELHSTPEDIDSFRDRVLRHWECRAAVLEPVRAQWVQNAPSLLQPLVRRVHGPLLAEMIDAVKLPDALLLQHMQTGFPLIGDLPPSPAPSKLDFVATDKRTVAELLAARSTGNRRISRTLTKSEHAKDLWDIALEDASLGAMSSPVPLDTLHLSQCTLSRRIP